MAGPQSRDSFSEAVLTGRRVLVVEDSPVVAEDTEQMLREFGCEIVGPAATMAYALEFAQDEDFDVAVVDINIRGGKAFSVLKILDERGIPFLLTSGYADWSMPEEWQERPRLPKPYNPAVLARQVAELFTG